MELELVNRPNRIQMYVDKPMKTGLYFYFSAIFVRFEVYLGLN